MRKLRGPVLFLAFSLLLGSAAMAAGNILRSNVPAVIYDAGTEEFSFVISGGAETADTDADDLFPGFKKLMPGDTATQTIQTEVRHIPTGQQVELFLHAEIPQAADRDILAPLAMEVAQSGAPVAGKADVPTVLREETSLGVFRTDGVMNLDVTLYVPLTVGNELQGESGRVNWVFTARTLPKDDPSPSDPQEPADPTPGGPDDPSPSDPRETADAAPGTSPRGPVLPQTGQDWRPVFLMAAAGAILLLIGVHMGKAGKGTHET